jgi:hypothetical protein
MRDQRGNRDDDQQLEVVEECVAAAARDVGHGQAEETLRDVGDQRRPERTDCVGERRHQIAERTGEAVQRKENEEEAERDTRGGTPAYRLFGPRGGAEQRRGFSQA